MCIQTIIFTCGSLRTTDGALVMRRSTRWILLFSYFYAIAIGVLHFAYDFETGRAFRKAWLTCYSIVCNSVILLSIPLLYDDKIRLTLQTTTAYLYQIIFVVFVAVRLLAVLLTMVLNWTKRNEALDLLQKIARLRQKFQHLKISDRIQRRFESAIIMKFMFAFITDVLMMVVTVDLFWAQMNFRVLLNLLLFAILTSILRVTVQRHYYGLLKFNLYFHTLNDELSCLLHAAEICSYRQHQSQRHRGHRAVQFCQLSDRLDEMAAFYGEHKRLANQYHNLCQFQGLSVMLTVYLFNVATMFWFYTLSKPNLHLLTISGSGIFMCICSLVAFFCDLICFHRVAFELLEASDQSSVLLRQHIGFHPLDVRWERSCDQFFLQSISEPLRFNMCGLFEYNGAMAFSVLVSTLMNSIMLLQLDLKNFN